MLIATLTLRIRIDLLNRIVSTLLAMVGLPLISHRGIVSEPRASVPGNLGELHDYSNQCKLTRGLPLSIR